jgi:hypothetical protein
LQEAQVKSIFAKGKASNTEHRLVPRKVQFDWHNTAIDWIAESTVCQPFYQSKSI